MVHIGAIVAALLSRLNEGPMRPLLAMRSPTSQRYWVGMGAAAGVAAAFNAPLGGILYSFEEVSRIRTPSLPNTHASLLWTSLARSLLPMSEQFPSIATPVTPSFFLDAPTRCVHTGRRGSLGRLSSVW